MKRRDEKSSKRLTRIAAIGIARPELLTRAEIRSLSGCVLTQAPDRKQRKLPLKGKARR